MAPRLLATKYSFRSDHPVMGQSGAPGVDQELLLHFRDPAVMATETDAELIDAGCLALVQTDGPCTVCHIPPTAGKTLRAYGLACPVGLRLDGRSELTA